MLFDASVAGDVERDLVLSFLRSVLIFWKGFRLIPSSSDDGILDPGLNGYDMNYTLVL